MASPLKAGAVVVNILGDNTQILQVLNKTHNSIENGLTKFPGFQGKLAVFRDFTMTIASLRGTFETLTQPLQRVFTSFSSFEFGMSKVQAITNATAESIGKLREQAKELGRTTFFTATQVADAQKFLAMAGFNPEQIEKATPQVLNLALAGDMDLGTAADIATNISTPFKIAAEDLVRVNDVLAKTVTSSNSNMMELGQAFKYAAPAAAAAGQSIEELGAAMSILANNGIKADTAGTSIRMMLIKLADAGIQAKLKEQFDIDVSDAEGKMRPLMDVLDELKLKTNGMGQTQQMSAFFDIFEQRAGTSALVLGSAGGAIADYRMKMVDAAGTSAQMSKTMADNIKGDWVAFMSVIEGVQIAIGEALNTFSRDWLQVFTSATRSVAKFIKENKHFIASMIKFGTYGTIGTIGIMKFIGAVKWLNATSAAYVAAKTTETAVVVANTTATSANTTAKRANITITGLMTAATTTLSNAWKALTISMAANPMMWIAAAVVGLAALAGYLALASEYQAKLSNIAAETSTKNNDTRNTDDKKFEYLDQLSQKQKLTNKELDDAKKIIDELQKKYGDFGLSIDKTTGKIIKAADAQKKLNKEMNQQSLNDLKKELAEGEKNVSELKKQKKSINYDARIVGAYLTLGYVDTAKDQNKKIREKQLEQAKKNKELRKKITAIEGGEDWRDVNNPKDLGAKTNEVAQLNEAQKRELENAENRLMEMKSNMRRSEQTDVENEIEDIRKRNEEYEKYVRLLLEAEKAKGESADKNKINNLQIDLDARAGYEANQLRKLAEKYKPDNTNYQLQNDVLDKRAALDAAIAGNDSYAIEKAKNELDDAKKALEDTSFKQVKANLDNARQEYKTALDVFNNATTDEEKAVAGQKLKDADDKLGRFTSTYEGMSEKQYNDKVLGLATNARELNSHTMSGSFSAFESSAMGANSGMLAEAKRTNLLLEKLNYTVEENDGMSFA